MDQPVNYSDYLQLDKILSSQKPASDGSAHDARVEAHDEQPVEEDVHDRSHADRHGREDGLTVEAHEVEEHGLQDHDGHEPEHDRQVDAEWLRQALLGAAQMKA